MKKILALSILSLASLNALAADDIIHLGAYAHQYTTIKGGQVYSKAEHDIEIINNSDHAKNYTYAYVYCVSESKCVQEGNSVSVAPHSKWNNHHDSYLQRTYLYEGNYNLVATTEVYDAHQKLYKNDSYGVVIVR